MINIDNSAGKLKQIIQYFRLLKARYNFFDLLTIDIKNPKKFGFIGIDGHQNKLALMKNKHKGQRCFIIANGPSLASMDLEPLKNEITIGCNGIYKAFEKWGFETDYLVFEDIDQTRIRAKEIEKLKNIKKFMAIYNAADVKVDENTTLFYSPRTAGHNNKSNGYYYISNDTYPQFSKDFASIVHLGSTVTYIMLQLAYHLGFDEVYIVGLDHSYGPLSELYEDGSYVKVTDETLEIVKQCHYDPNYYKVGDIIGVPSVKLQEKAYAEAKKTFLENGRKIYNASTFSKLEIFEKVEFQSLFDEENK